ncbi:App1 family protein [Flaviaesturariibacter amylovorans]|uniref:App1 family protein n=1 Tax=Flaviaesturariibacter amylovorans TaxID=1084520 RepID=A0ABP8GK70_9BACT
MVRGRVFRRLGLTNETVIKVYHGYGHASQLVLYGHVFRQSALPRRRYRQSVLNNTWALLRLFMVKPLPNVRLRTQWQGQVLETTADRDGFYKFEWQDNPPLEQGWHELKVELIGSRGQVRQTGTGSLYIPYATQYGFISDVDDTFLISHSANLRKRLYVLFTQNARSRRPFEGVVRHYQLLAQGNTTPDAPNPFFYVSSSEWNLYEYLLEFTRVQALPRGVFLLNVLKQVRELLKTGQSNHNGKFARIVRIVEGFPKQRFVLLGDSSQRDPYIYESIVRHFPGRIHAVYIRDVYQKSRPAVLEVLAKIEAAGVPVCFFRHSDEAILHSRKIGLISTEEAAKEIG